MMVSVRISSGMRVKIAMVLFTMPFLLSALFKMASIRARISESEYCERPLRTESREDLLDEDWDCVNMMMTN